MGEVKLMKNKLWKLVIVLLLAGCGGVNVGRELPVIDGDDDQPKTIPNHQPSPIGMTYSFDEDSTLLGHLSAIDIDGDKLEYKIIDLPKMGSLELINAETGKFRFEPMQNISGNDRFTFIVSDGELESEEKTVHLSIRPVNDRPSSVDIVVDLTGQVYDGESFELFVPVPVTDVEDKAQDLYIESHRFSPLSQEENSAGALYYKLYLMGHLPTTEFSVWDTGGAQQRSSVEITVTQFGCSQAYIDRFEGEGTVESPYVIPYIGEITQLGRLQCLMDKHFILSGTKADLNINYGYYHTSTFGVNPDNNPLGVAFTGTLRSATPGVPVIISGLSKYGHETVEEYFDSAIDLSTQLIDVEFQVDADCDYISIAAPWNLPEQCEE